MQDDLEIGIDARGVARVTLRREDKHNALSADLIAGLDEAARRLGADPAVRAVVLTGAGESFCAGGDLAWMTAQMQADAATRAAEARKLAAMLRALNEMPKPLIGRVQGQAFGGGIGLISVCDVAVGVETARFALTETRLGLIPATIGPYVVARLGEAGARRVFMSGRRFDAAEAVSLGLLARAVPGESLEAAVEAEVAPYLACAPGAVARAKAQVLSLGPRIGEEEIEASIARLVAAWETEEAAEGIAAFFARRKPAWSAPAEP
ncbi:crotonase/enoyl-CoA hydratase family protein [Rhodovulum sulfidophilum]|uniref:crotonase/enoyl-CoA hydratase family protein n=1 Tax=Rhodovulum sulfidophilum TaxID=35806 RepID=UPI00095105E1|nr:crotonase/enoyl-CoA hydratase family protein [Rhodovulum sulfidophilum]MBL3574661.1 crotonase/enoyl-CoA hydratase family protein [Rhodovulum sulfidophilum]MCE8431971.1 crotonase/enoyl-CoA hydratase family protein [Rhodovulum sulfidophilum]MCF4116205.1 crotonase/enoyl-CoA hydratase family protein [Rhodovulum sulfidophilum]OLS51156.1 enoyl-CoA hydratase [Rhodovulum sulfidophilum]